MGYYYDQGEPPREKPPGCLDTLVIIRVILGVMLVPMAVLIGVVAIVGVAFYLLTVHPALALVPLAALGIAVWLFARWDQARHRPDGL